MITIIVINADVDSYEIDKYHRDNRIRTIDDSDMLLRVLKGTYEPTDN